MDGMIVSLAPYVVAVTPETLSPILIVSVPVIPTIETPFEDVIVNVSAFESATIFEPFTATVVNESWAAAFALLKAEMAVVFELLACWKIVFVRST